jgi:hypothetical protein
MFERASRIVTAPICSKLTPICPAFSCSGLSPQKCIRGVQLLLTPFFIVVEKPNRIAGCRVTTFFGTTTCGVVAERVDWRKIAIALIDIGKGDFVLSPVAVEIAAHAG